MKLFAYMTDGHDIDIRPAAVERDWMDNTGQRFAYRCLPLNIANSYGWELLCRSGFSALWDGGQTKEAITVVADGGTQAPVLSHFAHGILTFHVPCLFRTEPGIDLMVQGPINRPKDGIAPLSGVIETDWAPYTFTMNWMFTRPGHAVRFEQGEPFCHIFPVRRGDIETVEPEIQALSQQGELHEQYQAWNKSRQQFNADLLQTGSTAQAERWQKMYYQGLDARGANAPVEDHRTRVRLRPFVRSP